MNSKAVFLAEVRRRWIHRKRYPVATITNLITFGIFSFVAWVGLRSAFFKNEGIYGASATLLWPLVMTGFGAAYSALEEDIEVGTIEQLYLSAPSVLHLLHIRALADLMDSLVVIVAPFFLAAGFYLGWDTLGRWTITKAIPLWLSLYGLGLILAGLILRYRRLGTLSNLINMGTLALAVVQGPDHGIWLWLQNLFPMVNASATPNWPVGWWLRYPAAVGYLLLGIWVFRRLETQAKRLGLIGKY